jgi:hypothetical protein
MPLFWKIHYIKFRIISLESPDSRVDLQVTHFPELQQEPPPTVATTPKFHCDVRASFARAFRAWRLQHNIPLKQVAKDLGLSIATINSWELGRRFPTGYNFEILVNYTGLPPCRLFCVMADQCVPADCLLALPRKP